MKRARVGGKSRVVSRKCIQMAVINWLFINHMDKLKKRDNGRDFQATVYWRMSFIRNGDYDLVLVWIKIFFISFLYRFRLLSTKKEVCVKKKHVNYSKLLWPGDRIILLCHARRFERANGSLETTLQLLNKAKKSLFLRTTCRIKGKPNILKNAGFRARLT